METVNSSDLVDGVVLGLRDYFLGPLLDAACIKSLVEKKNAKFEWAEVTLGLSISHT